MTEEYNFKLDDESVDIAFICTVLHEVEDIKRFVNEAKRILKTKGKIAIVEWKKQETDMGPPVNHRLDIKVVEAVLAEHGFKNVNSESIGEYFYCITATK